MAWQIEPMSKWPYPSTQDRRPSPFRAHWDDTVSLLSAELEHLQVRGAVAIRVVTDDASVRQDGMLRSRAQVWHPGVVVSFTSALHGPLSYPCDTFEAPTWRPVPAWQANVRAVALALESLRAVDRYGVTRRGEQYAGWRAIPAAGSPTPAFATAAAAREWLRFVLGVTGSTHLGDDRLLRRAAALTHPDRRGGDRTDWDRVDAARQALEANR